MLTFRVEIRVYSVHVDDDTDDVRLRAVAKLASLIYSARKALYEVLRRRA